jgi:hypothetical protein
VIAVNLTPAVSDIYAEASIALGEGWYLLEGHRGTKFRWVKNDAIIYVAAMSQTRHVVRLLIEPGPGLSLKPFTLEVYGENDELIASPTIAGKQVATIELPPSLPRVHRLRLHVEGGGLSRLDDPRILNFRVFDISVEAQTTDALPGWAKFGKNWYPFEKLADSSFRWANNDAVLEVTERGEGRIRFDIEPGPGVESKTFALHIRNATGEPLQTIQVGRARQTVTVEFTNVPCTLIFHVEGGGKSTPGDPRILNFRIFAPSQPL